MVGGCKIFWGGFGSKKKVWLKLGLVEVRLHTENLYRGSDRILVRVILDQAMLEAMLYCFRKLKSMGVGPKLFSGPKFFLGPTFFGNPHIFGNQNVFKTQIIFKTQSFFKTQI